MNKKMKYIMLGSLLFAAGGFNKVMAITPAEVLVQIQQTFDTVFNRLDNHDDRIGILEGDLEFFHPNFGGYSMAFAADGAPKNVVVSSQTDENGWTEYFVRSRYATSVEQISINGVLTQRPFIANYAYAQTNDLGALVRVTNYIEAPDTDNYVVFNVETSEYDLGTQSKIVTDDTLREDWNLCTYGITTICIPEVSLSLNGEHVRRYSWSSIRSLSGPITVNGMTFDDVRLEQNISSDNARVRAQGIGEILRVANDGSWQRRVIFYRANGVTGGSLAGTPFDAGQPLDGLFF